MENIWVAIIGAAALAVGSVLTLAGQWLLARKDKATKQLETEGSVEVARIEADSSERIELTKALLAHNQALQTHSGEQDQLIIKLTSENAKLTAQTQLLSAMDKVATREVQRLRAELEAAEARNVVLADELRSVRETLQGEVSDAIAHLESETEASEN